MTSTLHDNGGTHSSAPAANPAFIARKPQQQRARERVDGVLRAAEALLLEHGLSGFSIPALAERLQYPRATIYKFFPTPEALLNELAERQLAAMEQHLALFEAQLPRSAGWREPVARVVRAAADFYSQHPAAQVVLLTGPSSDASFRALEYTIQRLGTQMRAMLAQRDILVPAGPPDIAALAVEFGTAAFRMSYFLHGRMTPEYTQAACDVVLEFLARRLALPAE